MYLIATTTRVVVPQQSSRRAATPQEIAARKGLTFVSREQAKLTGQTPGIQETISPKTYSEATKIEDIKAQIRQGALAQADAQAGMNKVADVKTKLEALKEANQRIANIEKEAQDKYQALVNLQQQQASYEPGTKTIPGYVESPYKSMMLRRDQQPTNENPLDVSPLPDSIRISEINRVIEATNQRILARNEAMKKDFEDLQRLQSEYDVKFTKKGKVKVPSPEGGVVEVESNVPTTAVWLGRKLNTSPMSFFLMLRPGGKSLSKTATIAQEEMSKRSEIEQKKQDILNKYYDVHAKYFPESVTKMTVDVKPKTDTAQVLLSQGIGHENYEDALKMLGEYQNYQRFRSQTTKGNVKEEQKIDTTFNQLAAETNKYLDKENLKIAGTTGTILFVLPAVTAAVPAIGSFFSAPVVSYPLMGAYGVSLGFRGYNVAKEYEAGKPLTATRDLGGMVAEVGSLFAAGYIASLKKVPIKVIQKEQSFGINGEKTYTGSIYYNSKDVKAKDYVDVVIRTQGAKGKPGSVKTEVGTRLLTTMKTRYPEAQSSIQAYKDSDVTSFAFQNLKTGEGDVVSFLTYKGQQYTVQYHINPTGTGTTTVRLNNEIVGNYKFKIPPKDVLLTNQRTTGFEKVDTVPGRTTVKGKQYDVYNIVSREPVREDISIRSTTTTTPKEEVIGELRTKTFTRTDITSTKPSKIVQITKPQIDPNTGEVIPGKKTENVFETTFNIDKASKPLDQLVSIQETPTTKTYDYPAKVNVQTSITQQSDITTIVPARPIKQTFFEKHLAVFNKMLASRKAEATSPFTTPSGFEAVKSEIGSPSKTKIVTLKVSNTPATNFNLQFQESMRSIPIPLSQQTQIPFTTAIPPSASTGQSSGVASNEISPIEKIESQHDINFKAVSNAQEEIESPVENASISTLSALEAINTPKSIADVGVVSEVTPLTDTIASPAEEAISTTEPKPSPYKPFDPFKPKPPEPPRPQEPIIPPPFIGDIRVSLGRSPQPQKQSRKVKVRRKGKFITVGVISDEAQAIEFGKKIVGETAAATFTVEPTEESGKAFIGKSNVMVSEKKKSGIARVFMQPRETRIKSLGEKAEITARGIAASRSSRKSKSAFGGRSKIRL